MSADRMTRSIETAAPGTEQPWGDLERLAKAATHKEWQHGEGGSINVPRGGTLFASFRGNGTTDDAAFIAAANPATVLELIAAARAGSVGVGGADEPKTPTEQAEGAVVGALADLFVTGPVWKEPDLTDEDDNPIWTSEVQTIGGWSVVAKVHGADATEASRRAEAICRTLNALQQAPTPASVSPGTEGE